MADLAAVILETLKARNHQPIKATSLARMLGISASATVVFRRALKNLLQQGKIQLGRNSMIRLAPATVTLRGTFKRLSSGMGLVRTFATKDRTVEEYLVPAEETRDASNGDEVVIQVVRAAKKGSQGQAEVLEVKERAASQFVGTYFERDGEAFVRVDGTVFARSVAVPDAASKGAKPDDKVMLDIIRFPTAERRGEGVIIEVLGKRGDPGIDVVSVLRSLGIPDTFPEEALAEARMQAAKFNEADYGERDDYTSQLTITIDPVDAKDFDDAVSLEIDPRSKHWLLTVHIADVGHFAPAGSFLDHEARKRGISVYLPRRVIPMFPELISNGLASLQEGKPRYVMTVRMEFTPSGQKVGATFASSVIRVRKRFTYEQVSSMLEAELDAQVDLDIVQMLSKMRELALILRERRKQRGALEMNMPEAILEYNADGEVSGAHFAVNDISHQIIEEFMLSANEAVAEHFAALKVPFMRRVHPAPDPTKLKAFAQFAAILGHPVDRYADRFELQRVLQETADKPERQAIHYALLRSLKQAIYSPFQEDHFALASEHYCHFTSPIRRYPDLMVHRQLGQWLRKKHATADEEEMVVLAEHCSKTERRAESAEREVVKLKLLRYLAERIGMQLDAIITGVTDYGFFAQGEAFPAEGLVHISSLVDDYYHYDEDSHTLEGLRSRRRYRLGDKVQLEVVHVDINRRQLDFRVVASPSATKTKAVGPAPLPIAPNKKRGSKKGKRGRH